MRVALHTAELACQARQVADRAVDDRLEVLLQGGFGPKRSIAVFASCLLCLRLDRLLDVDLIPEVVVESNVVLELFVAVTAAKLSGVFSYLEVDFEGSSAVEHPAAVVASPIADGLERILPARRR